MRVEWPTGAPLLRVPLPAHTTQILVGNDGGGNPLAVELIYELLL